METMPTVQLTRWEVFVLVKALDMLDLDNQGEGFQARKERLMLKLWASLS